MDHHFSADRLRRLAEIERGHFWFIGRRMLLDHLIARYLDRQPLLVLDVGCGTGLMMRALAAQGHRVVGADERPEGLQAARRADHGVFPVQADAAHLPLRDGLFGAAFMLDVLEHADDAATLAEVHRVLRPGGTAVLTVPAMGWLWSYRDVAAGHIRRYGRRQLERLIGGAGLLLRDLRYYQCLLFPLLMASRLLGRSGPLLRDLEDQPLPALNTIMRWITSLEAGPGRRIRWPWGSTLVAVCQRVP